MSQKRLTDEEFRTILDWLMVSDPWILNREAFGVIEKLVLDEAKVRGYSSYSEAYHELETDRID